jgi:hypothetical protein
MPQHQSISRISSTCAFAWSAKSNSMAMNGDADKRRLIFIQVLHCILSAGTSSSVPAAPATSVVATPDRKVSFGLQFIGLRVQLTVLVPVNAVLSVNLLLFDFDFKTCSMAQAVEYLATMIGIAEANATLDVSIRNALFGDAPEALKAQ